MKNGKKKKGYEQKAEDPQGASGYCECLYPY